MAESKTQSPITSFSKLEPYLDDKKAKDITVTSFQEFNSSVSGRCFCIIGSEPFPKRFDFIENNCNSDPNKDKPWLYFLASPENKNKITTAINNSANYRLFRDNPNLFFKKQVFNEVKTLFGNKESNLNKFILLVAMGNVICTASNAETKTYNYSQEFKFGSRSRCGNTIADTQAYIKEAFNFLTQYISNNRDYSFSQIYNSFAIDNAGQRKFKDELADNYKSDSKSWQFAITPPNITELKNYSSIDSLLSIIPYLGEQIANSATDYLETRGNFYKWSYKMMAKQLVKAANELMVNVTGWTKWNNQAFYNCCADRYFLKNTPREFTTEVIGNRTYNRMSFAEDDIRIAMRDSSNNIFYASDYTWSFNNANLASYGLQPDDFQTITIYEFQPDRQVAWKTIIDGISQAVTENNWAQKVASFVGAGSGLVTTGAEAITKKVLANDSQGQAKGTNVKWVNDVMKGKWVGQYQVPFFSDDFMKAWSAENWSMGNAFEGKDLLVNNLTANVQDIPTWKFEQGSPLTWKYNFFLINDNISSLRNNLKFLMSFISGAYWFQDSTFSYRSPNLYRIICPGRFIQLYTALNIEVSYVGKIKKYNKNDASMIFGNSDPRFTRFLTDEGACNIPEAYKINLMVQDMTPQAFNINANYFTDAKSELIPNIAVNMKGSSLSAAKEDFVQAVDNAIDAGGKAVSYIKSAFGI